jgi:hypothetical protein
MLKTERDLRIHLTGMINGVLLLALLTVIASHCAGCAS